MTPQPVPLVVLAAEVNATVDALAAELSGKTWTDDAGLRMTDRATARTVIAEHQQRAQQRAEQARQREQSTRDWCRAQHAPIKARIDALAAAQAQRHLPPGTSALTAMMSLQDSPLHQDSDERLSDWLAGTSVYRPITERPKP